MHPQLKQIKRTLTLSQITWMDILHVPISSCEDFLVIQHPFQQLRVPAVPEMQEQIRVPTLQDDTSGLGK